MEIFDAITIDTHIYERMFINKLFILKNKQNLHSSVPLLVWRSSPSILFGLKET